MSMKSTLLKGICTMAAVGIVLTAASGLVIQNNVQAAELYQVSIIKVQDTTVQGNNNVITYGATGAGGVVGAAVLAKNNQGMTAENIARTAVGGLLGAVAGQKLGNYMDSSSAKQFIVKDDAGKKHVFTEAKTDSNESCAAGDEAMVYFEGKDLHIASCDTPMRASLSSEQPASFSAVAAQAARSPGRKPGA